LFWIPEKSLAPGAVSVNLDAGTARMTVRKMNLEDYFNNINALVHSMVPASVPATTSFDIQWSGPITKVGPVTAPPGSTGQLILNQATMQWSASNAQGFSFVSNPAGTTSAFAQLGHVSNGRFAGSA
jgi:hypothetical protein